jgi:hypothetical protein
MRRELRSVSTEQVLGAVVLDGAALTLEGGAQNVLARTVERFGADAGKILMDEGWSNGYLYLGPAQP